MHKFVELGNVDRPGGESLFSDAVDVIEMQQRYHRDAHGGFTWGFLFVVIYLDERYFSRHGPLCKRHLVHPPQVSTSFWEKGLVLNDVFWCVAAINFVFRPTTHDASTSVKLPPVVTMDDPEDDDVGLPLSHGNSSRGSVSTGTRSKKPVQKFNIADPELLKQRKALPIWSGGLRSIFVWMFIRPTEGFFRPGEPHPSCLEQ